MNAPLSVTDTVICMGASISAGLGMERASIWLIEKVKSICLYWRFNFLPFRSNWINRKLFITIYQ